MCGCRDMCTAHLRVSFLFPDWRLRFGSKDRLFYPLNVFCFFFLSIYIFFIYYYCVCLCAMVHIWRTEDNSVEWALSFYLYMGSRNRVWRSGLVWQTSLPDEPSHQSTSLSFETILLCTWGCPGTHYVAYTGLKLAAICWRVVAYTFNASIWDAEAGGSLRSRPAWSMEGVPGQSRLYREISSWKTKVNKQTIKQEKTKQNK